MGYETGTPDIASRIGDRERSDSETLLACSDQTISGSPAQAARAQPRANGAGAHRCLPPAAARVSPQEPGGGGGTAQSSPRLRPAPPPLPDGSAAPSAPRSAQTEQPPLQCQQPQRRRRRERQWPGPRGSRQRRTARHAHSATPRPPRGLRGAAGGSALLGTALGHWASRSAATHKGPRTPGVRELRPGTGQGKQQLRVSTPALLGRPEPSPERARHMTAATHRPGSAGVTSSAAPRPTAPGVALAAPR